MRKIILLALIFSFILSPLCSFSRPSYPNLVYQVLGGTYDYSWLIIEIVAVRDYTLVINLTYVETEKVVCRGVTFYRPFYSKSILVEVDTRTWETYYNGEKLGRFPFYGIRLVSGERVASSWRKPIKSTLVDKTRLYHWTIVDVRKLLVVNETSIECVIKHYVAPLSEDSIYFKLIRMLKLPVLEIFVVEVKALDFAYSWTVEKNTGIPIKIILDGNYSVQELWHEEKRLEYLLPSTILTLLGVKHCAVLYLFEVTWSKPELNIRESIEVDPRPEPLQIIVFEEKKLTYW